MNYLLQLLSKKKIITVKNKIVEMLKKLIKKTKNKHVTNEAKVPGAYLILPIFSRVKNNKLNFLIIFNY